jgi:predicted nucleic-acid-binding protein
MAKQLVDANVILRYLLRDEENLFQKASAILERARTGEERVFILESVLTECLYVLLKIYKIDRLAIAEKLRGLLYYKGVVNSDKEDLIAAIDRFGQTKLSLADCLLIAKSKSTGMPIFTFDEELKKISRKN